MLTGRLVQLSFAARGFNLSLKFDYSLRTPGSPMGSSQRNASSIILR